MYDYFLQNEATAAKAAVFLSQTSALLDVHHSSPFMILLFIA